MKSFLIPIGGAALYVYIVHALLVFYVLAIFSYERFKGLVAVRRPVSEGV